MIESDEPKRHDPLPTTVAANNATQGLLPVILPPTMQQDTLLNSLLGWRVTNLPGDDDDDENDEGVEIKGKFGKNCLVLNGRWVQKAEVGYAPIGYANVKEKVEARWESDRSREFGPPMVSFGDF